MNSSTASWRIFRIFLSSTQWKLKFRELTNDESSLHTPVRCRRELWVFILFFFIFTISTWLWGSDERKCSSSSRRKEKKLAANLKIDERRRKKLKVFSVFSLWLSTLALVVRCLYTLTSLLIWVTEFLTFPSRCVWVGLVQLESGADSLLLWIQRLTRQISIFSNTRFASYKRMCRAPWEISVNSTRKSSNFIPKQHSTKFSYRNFLLLS